MNRGSIVVVAVVLAVFGCGPKNTASQGTTGATTPAITPAPPPAPPTPPPPAAPAPPPAPPSPPPPPSNVSYVVTWPYDQHVFYCNVGDRIVCKFTTGSAAPTQGIFSVAEYQSPPVLRHCFIATDAAGTNKVPSSESWGTSAVSFIGAAGAALQANTTYYYVFEFTFQNGQLSGPAGSFAETIFSLNNVKP